MGRKRCTKPIGTGIMTLQERNQAILDLMSIVNWTARKIGRLYRGVEMEDLVYAGIIGLMKSLACYRPGRGTSMQTFACRHIYRFVRRAADEAVRRRNKFVDQTSLDCCCAGQQFEKEHFDKDWLLIRDEIAKIRKILTPREWRIMWERYARGRLCREIGGKMSLSISRVGQVCDLAMAKIRERYRGE